MIKIHDLEGVGKTEPPHAGQTFGPIDQQYNLRCHAQATTQRLLP